MDHAGRGNDSAIGMERRLREALNGDQLRLVYQPKIVLADDRVAGVEALIRWQHPEQGFLAPAEFIPLAESSGLIVPIGTWVIDEACRQTACWRTQFPDRPPLVTSVNVSAHQFGPGLVHAVRSALERSALPSSSLCIELTESILIKDVEMAVATLRGLAELGVSLSIDDFGTGYSSLSYLKQLPLDELKIDKSFVDGLGHDPNDTAIVAAIVAMAHALDLYVVAEGVETAEQLERLRVLGCEQAQGYYFARPQRPADLAKLLSAEAAATWSGDDGGEGQLDSYRADRVLIVDDTSEVRQLARMSLTTVGFEVHEAPDATTARSIARDVRPHCIIVDLVMPGMSGLELCRLLREDTITAGSTIIMLTSNDDAADKIEAFSSGADDYITKPFSPRDLSTRVRAAMKRRAKAGGS